MLHGTRLHFLRSLGISLLLLAHQFPLAAQEPATPAATTKYSGSSTVAYTNSMDVLDDTRILGFGDKVSFRVVEDRKDPVSLVVTDSGEMEVPLIGRVHAASRTCKQLAYAIRGPLEKTYFYKATVIIGLDVVSVRSRGRIYVTGQVRTQGPQEIPSDENFTLSKAILRAGGLADFANKKKIKLIRKTGTLSDQTQTTIVNLEDIMDRGQADKDPVLKPDDLVVVPERLINF
jgi:protein involved in polysaccharide export with SLBB domain